MKLDTLIDDIYGQLSELSEGREFNLTEEDLDFTLSRIKDSVLAWQGLQPETLSLACVCLTLVAPLDSFGTNKTYLLNLQNPPQLHRLSFFTDIS